MTSDDFLLFAAVEWLAKGELWIVIDGAAYRPRGGWLR